MSDFPEGVPWLCILCAARQGRQAEEEREASSTERGRRTRVPATTFFVADLNQGEETSFVDPSALPNTQGQDKEVGEQTNPLQSQTTTQEGRWDAEEEEDMEELQAGLDRLRGSPRQQDSGGEGERSGVRRGSSPHGLPGSQGTSAQSVSRGRPRVPGGSRGPRHEAPLRASQDEGRWIPGGPQSQDDFQTPTDHTYGGRALHLGSQVSQPSQRRPAGTPEPAMGGLPTWEEAHSTIIPTTRHIPKGAREDWARTLGGTSLEVVDDEQNTDKWLLLYILAKCVLCTKPRGQGYTATSHAQVIRAACRRWRNGEAAALWQEALKRRRKPTPSKGRGRSQTREEPTQETKNLERAAMLLQEGQFSRAAKALISRGMDQHSAAARDEMEAKHPEGQGAKVPEEENTTPPITLTGRQVYEAIQGFKAGTAPGPSGLRAEHLKEAKAARTEGRGAAVVGALTRLVNTMAAGKVPTEVTPYFCGGNLFAAVKKSGGLRPVAVGDILRRLTSKCIAYSVAGRASVHLRPLQFGVGVRGGCEGVVHATRATLEDETILPDRKWMLQVDFVNGFNQVDRTHMFTEVRKNFPRHSSLGGVVLWGGVSAQLWGRFHHEQGRCAPGGPTGTSALQSHPAPSSPEAGGAGPRPHPEHVVPGRRSTSGDPGSTVGGVGHPGGGRGAQGTHLVHREVARVLPRSR